MKTTLAITGATHLWFSRVLALVFVQTGEVLAIGSAVEAALREYGEKLLKEHALELPLLPGEPEQEDSVEDEATDD